MINVVPLIGLKCKKFMCRYYIYKCMIAKDMRIYFQFKLYRRLIKDKLRENDTLHLTEPEITSYFRISA